MQKHVFLVGLIDQIEMRELLSSRFLRVDLHDCDEYLNDPSDEERITFTYGQAKFSIKDFLKPHVRSLKLRSDVFPMKRS
jgi:hypothetical protein